MLFTMLTKQVQKLNGGGSLRYHRWLMTLGWKINENWNKFAGSKYVSGFLSTKTITLLVFVFYE